MKKFSIYLLMTISIIAFSLILLMLCPWFNVTHTEITGLDNLNETQILADLNLNKTVNIIAFNKHSAKNKLKKNPYIESVEIKKVFPSKLNIQIKERKICGYIPYLNSFLYIDDEGRVIDVQSVYTKKLPLLVGLQFNSFTLGEKLETENEIAFNTLVHLSGIMTKYDVLEDVVKVDVSDSDNMRLFVNNIDVRLGPFKDLDWKISRLKEIIKTIPPEDKGFLYIDDKNKNPRFEYLT